MPPPTKSKTRRSPTEFEVGPCAAVILFLIVVGVTSGLVLHFALQWGNTRLLDYCTKNIEDTQELAHDVGAMPFALLDPPN